MIASAAAPSAGGSPLDQLVIVSAFTLAAQAVLLWVMLAERRGRRTLVGRAADLVARVDGGPRWFALPALVSVLGAVSGAVGVYWDVSYHITEGRDEGPLANPSHYLIFLGLLAIFFGGALGMALAHDRLPRRTLRVSRSWRAPIGPTVTTGIALCALAGFPMDDMWHRIFGQDVTEWGPTHVLMIGGTIMLPFGLLLSAAEARQVGQVGRSRIEPFLTFIAHTVLVVGPVAFLLEYAYGVPQFPLVMDVVVLTVGVTAGLVLASHRGPAYVVAVWVSYLVLQGLLQLTNEVVWGVLSPRWPLMAGGVVTAALLARLARPTAAYGAVAGALVGAVTVPAEVLWTNAFRPVEWPTSLLPWAVLLAALTGAGMGVVVTWMHTRLVAAGASGPPAEDTPAPARPRLGAAALAGLFAVLAVFAWNVPPRSDLTGEADITVGEVVDGRAFVEVEVDPALVADATWFHVLSWQGGGLVRADLEEVSPGVFRSAEPVPVVGTWKTTVRLHTGLHTLVAAPVHLPADPAIPAPAYPAADGPRDFVEERRILQRELKDDVPTWLWSTGYLAVGAVFAVLFTVVAVGYSVVGRPGSASRPLLPSRRPRDLAGTR